jgi:hypothetical protein
MPGRGFYGLASQGAGGMFTGDCNGSIIEHMYIHSATHDWFTLEGADANACKITVLHTHTPGGRRGIFDTAYFPNHYDQVHISGYGNMGVHRNGAVYQLNYHGTGPGGVGAGSLVEPGQPTPAELTGVPWNFPPTDKIWMFVRAEPSPTARFVAWSSSDTHFCQHPVYSVSGGLFSSAYVEFSEIAAHVVNGSLAISGTIATDRYSNRLLGGDERFNFSQRLMVTRDNPPGSTEATNHGDVVRLWMGGGDINNGWDPNYGMNILSWEVTRGIGISRWHFGKYNGRISLRNPLGGETFQITDETSTDTFGRSTPQRGKFVVTDLWLTSPWDPAHTRMIGMRNLRPNAGQGENARGDTFVTAIPNDMGAWAFVCTSPGTPGSFGTVPIFGLTAVDPQNNGDAVVEFSDTGYKMKYKTPGGTSKVKTFTWD